MYKRWEKLCREGRPDSTKTRLHQGVFEVPTEGNSLFRTNNPPMMGFPARGHGSPMNAVCANEPIAPPLKCFPVGKRVISDVCFPSHVDGLNRQGVC